MLPVSEIKVDCSLTADLDREPGAADMYESLIDLAHRLDLSCCAEGVETAEQLRLLDKLACDRVQGYYIGKPVSAAETPKALTSWTVQNSRTQVKTSSVHR
jgi:EAL domain-containing protein (putative c-di-GMP-specific phosphodiesterase class I)